MMSQTSRPTPDFGWNNTSDNITTSDGNTVSLDEESSLNIEITWPYTQEYRDRVLEGNYLRYTKVVQP